MQDEFKAAARKTALSVAAAACFGLALNYAKSTTAALEFASGYLVEQSLSVDNLFVFILLFDYFNVPSKGKVSRLYFFFLLSLEPSATHQSPCLLN